MDQFIQQFATGLSTGSLYAIIALALVLIYRSTSIVNFAQGDMAMFMTFVAWSIWTWNGQFWIAFFAILVIAFAFGALIEMVTLRPVETGPVLNPIIVTIGLVLVLESLALRIWQGQPKPFPTPTSIWRFDFFRAFSVEHRTGRHQPHQRRCLLHGRADHVPHLSIL